MNKWDGPCLVQRVVCQSFKTKPCTRAEKSLVSVQTLVQKHTVQNLNKCPLFLDLHTTPGTGPRNVYIFFGDIFFPIKYNFTSNITLLQKNTTIKTSLGLTAYFILYSCKIYEY